MLYMKFISNLISKIKESALGPHTHCPICNRVITLYGGFVSAACLKCKSKGCDLVVFYSTNLLNNTCSVESYSLYRNVESVNFDVKISVKDGLNISAWDRNSWMFKSTTLFSDPTIIDPTLILEVANKYIPKYYRLKCFL